MIDETLVERVLKQLDRGIITEQEAIFRLMDLGLSEAQAKTRVEPPQA